MWVIWRACDRFRVKPPRVKDKWEDCDPMTQARLLVFDQGMAYKEDERALRLNPFVDQ